MPEWVYSQKQEKEVVKEQIERKAYISFQRLILSKRLPILPCAIFSADNTMRISFGFACLGS